MFYQFGQDVYLVNGYTNSCIYDLKECVLYSLNSELSNQFKLLDSGNLTDDLCDEELKECLVYFVENGVVELSEKFNKTDIKTVAYEDTSISFAWIEITNQCNLRCKHCYNESDAQCEKVMSYEQFCLVIDCLVEKGIDKIQIIGGEPFCYKTLLKQDLDYAIGKFSKIEIFTNGTLITDEWFKYLSENSIAVALSVYSYNSDEHDKVTNVVGSWDKTNKTIKCLKKHGIKYRVCDVLMKNIDIGAKNTELYDLSPDKDIVRMTGRGNFNLLSDDLIKKRLITKDTFKQKANISFFKRLIAGHNCFNSRIYISADLDVYPCVMERRIKHCNVLDSNEIILDESIRKLNKDHIDSCKECEYRYACFDCRPNSLSGEILEKPWYCTYDPYAGEWCDIDCFIEDLKLKWEK